MWCFFLMFHTHWISHAQWYEILVHLSVVGFDKSEYFHISCVLQHLISCHFQIILEGFFLPLCLEVGYAMSKFPTDLLPITTVRNSIPYVLLMIFLHLFFFKKGSVWELSSVLVLSCLLISLCFEREERLYKVLSKSSRSSVCSKGQKGPWYPRVH